MLDAQIVRPPTVGGDSLAKPFYCYNQHLLLLLFQMLQLLIEKCLNDGSGPIGGPRLVEARNSGWGLNPARLAQR